MRKSGIGIYNFFFGAIIVGIVFGISKGITYYTLDKYKKKEGFRQPSINQPSVSKEEINGILIGVGVFILVVVGAYAYNSKSTFVKI